MDNIEFIEEIELFYIPMVSSYEELEEKMKPFRMMVENPIKTKRKLNSVRKKYKKQTYEILKKHNLITSYSLTDPDTSWVRKVVSYLSNIRRRICG